MSDRLTQLVRNADDEISMAVRSHARPVLAFSGGKDSLTCLYLARPHWDRIAVLWGNAGDPYPETEEQMRQVREMVPNFIEARGPGYVRQHAEAGTYPADMVPWAATSLGRQLVPDGPRFTLHSPMECCASNVWGPMREWIDALCADLLIRGEREGEAQRSPVQNGSADGGRTQVLPIRAWSKDDVLAYLESQGVEIPRQYAYGMASLDCMHCTAYLSEKRGNLRYLRDFHPAAAQEFERRLTLVRGEQERSMRLTLLALGEVEGREGEGLGD